MKNNPYDINNENNINCSNKSNYMIQDENNQKHLRLSALLEGVHMGRIYLVNSLQVGAFIEYHLFENLKNSEEEKYNKSNEKN